MSISRAALTKGPRHLRAVPRVAEPTIGNYWPDVSFNSTDIRSGDVECVCVLFVAASVAKQTTNSS